MPLHSQVQPPNHSGPLRVLPVMVHQFRVPPLFPNHFLNLKATNFLKSREPSSPQGHSVGLEWCHFRWLSSGSRLLRWRPLFPIKRWNSQEQAMGPPLTCFSPRLAPCLHSATHGCCGGCGLESSGTVWLTVVQLDCLVERVVGLPPKRPKF